MSDELAPGVAPLVAPRAVALATALTTHPATAGASSIGTVYEVPKGAKAVVFYIDRSALDVEDVKPSDPYTLRTVIEQSIDGGLTFGRAAGGAYTEQVGVDEKGRPVFQSFSLHDEATFSAGHVMPEEPDKVADVAQSQVLGSRATHIRFSYELKEPLEFGVQLVWL